MSGPVRRSAEADDWARYGGAHRDASPAGSLPATASREEANREDPYRNYRYEEAGGGIRRTSGDRRLMSRRRPGANLMGAAAAVAALVATAFLLNLRASGLTPPESESPRHTSVVTSGSANPSATVAPTVRMAHVGVSAQLPFSPVVPDRDFTPDDGRSIFLAGDSGAVVVDAGTGAISSVFGGADYPSRVRRSIFDNGLWLSNWSGSYPYCGPECWVGATTYRIDPQTGAITLKLAGTYLIGISFDGLWVAARNQVELLDPISGDVLATIPWKTAGEPRFGCGTLWSFSHDTKQTLLSLVDSGSGDASAPWQLDPAVGYGPITVQGQCWAMSGTGGAAKGPSQLVWLNPAGEVFDTRKYEESVVVLDAEFWMYRSDGTLQRLEASSGVNYGRRFQLAVQPAQGNPLEFFAAVGNVWLCEGDQLIAFDIRTGVAASAD